MSEIAYVTRYLGGGTSGASRSATDVLIALLATKMSVTVVSTSGSRHCALPAQVDGQPLGSPHWITPPRPFPGQVDRRFPRQVAGWFRNAVQDPFWARRLRQLDPPGLTIVNGLGSHDFWERISRVNSGLKGPSVLIVRESPRYFNDSRLLNLDWALEAMDKHTHLIFVSSYGRDEWRTLSSFEGKELFCIPNCCQEDLVARLLTQKRAQVRQRLGLPPDRFVAVCVASIQYRKGQDLLLKYFPDLLAVIPDLMIYLIGPIDPIWGKPLHQQIGATRRSPKVSDRGLQVLGPKFNALDYVYAADALVLPSRAEAMPRVILEAMALKTPVIASDVGGIPELIEHGQSGLLFSHDQPRGLVDAFEHLAADPDIRRIFAERAYQKYWSNFSRAHQIKRYGEAIGKMLV